MRANVTLRIEIDATAPELNDRTVDVSHAIRAMIRDNIKDYLACVEHTPETLIVSFALDGDFEEIHP